ncbi:MAG: homoserine dehydrogenase [Christensenellales bacterium]|jgi:homoserine dehydrogenase
MNIGIGFLGFGHIGSGVWSVLNANANAIAHKEGVSFTLRKALVRHLHKPRAAALPDGVLTDRFEDILGDPGISIVAEFMGGVDPACGYIEALLRAGKSVVTANKEVIAQRWHCLETAAREGGAGLYYEASVGGGIPIIRTITDSLQANEIDSVMGIINGTTNHILTRMSEQGYSYGEALREAQENGLAEPDPRNDVEGFDAAYKLSILSSLAFHARVPVDRIYREGITHMTPEVIRYGQELGYAVKLLAIGKKRGTSIEARVHPTFIPVNHPLSSVRGAYNAVFLHGNAVGNLMLYGRGAGDQPTASAIISDCIVATKAKSHRYNSFRNEARPAPEVTFDGNWRTKYFLNLEVIDRPGVLAAIAGVLARRQVSVASIIQKGYGTATVPLIFVTHQTNEQSMIQAVREIGSLPEIIEVKALIRVEDEDSA